MQAHVPSVRPPISPGEVRVETTGYDYAVAGVGIVLSLMQLASFVFLFKNRTWPPLRSRSFTLTFASMLGGIAAWIGLTLLYGSLARSPGSFLTNCSYVDYTLVYLGLGVWSGSLLARSYRHFMIFIRHATALWSPVVHLIVLSSPWIGSVSVFWMFPDSTYTSAGFCTSAIGDSLDWVMVSLLVIETGFLVWFWWELRLVRVQFNEFTTMSVVLTVLAATAVAFPILRFSLWDCCKLTTRVVLSAMFLTCTNTYYWLLHAKPVWKLLRNDTRYVAKFTYEFRALPTVDLLRAPLGEALTNAQVRKVFRAYAGRADDVADFLELCIERDTCDDWFVTQAQSMLMIDEFIRPGARREISLEHDIRQSILRETDINRPDLFDGAKQAVLSYMAPQFEEFKRTKEFKQLAADSVREEKEIRALSKANLVTAEAQDRSGRKPRSSSTRSAASSAADAPNTSARKKSAPGKKRKTSGRSAAPTPALAPVHNTLETLSTMSNDTSVYGQGDDYGSGRIAEQKAVVEKANAKLRNAKKSS